MKNKKKNRHYDVIVAGGGTGGVPAAVAAARNGAKVLLVERYGFLGGMATSGLVYPYMKYSAGDKVITQGLFSEFLDRLEKAGGLDKNRHNFDDEIMRCLLDRFALDAGVDLFFHALVIGVSKAKGRIRSIKVSHKGGMETFSAGLFIDATGDGDLAAMAGAKIKIGREKDHGCQPMTTSFRMAGVDAARMPAREEINRLFDMAKADGTVKNPRENVLWFRWMRPDVIHFNTTRVVRKSAVDGRELSEAEVEGRRQVLEMASFLKNRVPGFEKSWLMKSGTQIGVRESRRVMGRYVLTAKDVLSGRRFEDGIACSSYCIDIHSPDGSGTDLRYLKEGEYYTIPYRCILPKGLDNLLIASRGISSDHEAHSSLRIMPVVWAIGEAAGTAAALCGKSRPTPSGLDPAILRSALKGQGAFVV